MGEGAVHKSASAKAVVRGPGQPLGVCVCMCVLGGWPEILLLLGPEAKSPLGLLGASVTGESEGVSHSSPLLPGVSSREHLEMWSDKSTRLQRSQQNAKGNRRLNQMEEKQLSPRNTSRTPSHTLLTIRTGSTLPPFSPSE